MLRRARLLLATLLFVASSVASQESEAWTRWQGALPAAFEAAPLQELRERNGGKLWIEEGRLLRSFKREESELGCTLEGGPGQLHALGEDPFGLTFVAAERGLFLTAPESEVIDRLRLKDGTPTTPPNSLVIDGARRVWLASDTEFGVMEPSHFFGRTISVPVAGPYRILGVHGSAILLEGGGEVWSYQPDVGPAPRVSRVERDGEQLASGDLVEITYGESLGLQVAGEAVGGAVLRYAVDESHVWALFEDVGAEIEPGEHKLELVAMDRDLRLSEPFVLAVRVLYPFYYRTWFVFSMAGLAFVLSLLGFWARARRSKQELGAGYPAPLPRALLSTVLLLVVGLQALAGAIPHGRGWPFIGYSMYTESRDVGHISHNGMISGFGRRGVQLRVPFGVLGMAVDNRWQLLRPLMQLRGPRDGSVPQALIERYNAKYPDWEQLVRVQVWARRTLITEEGPVELAPLILSDHWSTSLKEGE